MDYQYFLSAWIYKMIGSADHAFSTFLHEEGYVNEYKRFKLFSYSLLDFGRPALLREKALFELHAEQLFLSVSFHLPEAAEKFIIGLFNRQQVYIGNRHHGLELVVSQVERLPEPILKNTMHYRAVSPVVISKKEEGDRYTKYLAPEEEKSIAILRQNLFDKYHSIPGALPLPADAPFEFKLTSEPRSKLVVIKPQTAEQSKVRGYVFAFTLSCPVELHSLIFSTGIGEKNSIGFGWVEENRI
jgi:CRISPR-associated endoribonuclease Cas6